jgi:hypothetical protein
MNRFLGVFIFLLCVSSLTSVVRAGGESELLGLGFGAAAGGVIGNQFGKGAGRVAATATGVFAGAYVGDELGRQFDQPAFYGTRMSPYASPSAFDYQAYSTPNYVAPPAPDPSQIYINNFGGGVCQNFSQQINTENGIQENNFIACQQPDGSWRVAP